MICECLVIVLSKLAKSGQIDLAEANQLLLNLSNNPNEDIQASVAFAFGNLAIMGELHSKTFDVLERFLTIGTKLVQVHACNALKRIAKSEQPLPTQTLHTLILKAIKQDQEDCDSFDIYHYDKTNNPFDTHLFIDKNSNNNFMSLTEGVISTIYQIQKNLPIEILEKIIETPLPILLKGLIHSGLVLSDKQIKHIFASGNCIANDELHPVLEEIVRSGHYQEEASISLLIDKILESEQSSQNTAREYLLSELLEAGQPLKDQEIQRLSEILFEGIETKSTVVIDVLKAMTKAKDMQKNTIPLLIKTATSHRLQRIRSSAISILRQNAKMVSTNDIQTFIYLLRVFLGIDFKPRFSKSFKYSCFEGNLVTH